MRVAELFHSVQGESSFAGRPCVFVRLAGCNLRCAYCDTPHAYADGVELTVDEVLDRVRGYGCGLVEITGGEPLFQPSTPELASRLCDAGYRVLVETNGSLDIAALDARCARVVDIKCPSSREAARFEPINLDRLTATDEVKLVIADEADYLFAVERLAAVRKRVPGITVLFAPVFGVLAPKTLVEWMLRDRLDARLNLQLHKYIWDPATRGV